MTKLSIINNEARRVLRQIPEHQLPTLQNTLAKLCQTRWQELQGPEAATPLVQALSTIMPPAADLFVEMYGSGDLRLDDALAGASPATGLAALVLAGIESEDLEAAHIAYEAMKLFESPAAGQAYADAVSRALSGELDQARLHRKMSKREPLWKALVVITEHTGRHDLKAQLEVIQLLTAPKVSALTDEFLEQLCSALQQIGVHFLGLEADRIQFELHDRPHKPVGRKHFADMLAEIRHLRLDY